MPTKTPRMGIAPFRTLDLIHHLEDVFALDDDLDTQGFAHSFQLLLHRVEVGHLGIERLMSSMFAPHSASAVATSATMPLRSLPRTETTHFIGWFLSLPAALPDCERMFHVKHSRWPFRGAP